MPFDFKKYDAKCANMDKDELQREWEHYTRLISGAATSTAVSGAAIPLTLGVSTIGVGLAAPAIHNARKKRDIIDRHLQRVGATHHTRKRDVLTPMAVSGTIGVVALSVSSIGADALVGHAAEHGISYIVENELAVKIGTHLACDGIAMAGEEVHMKSKKEQESWKAYMMLVQQGKVPPPPPGTNFKGPAPTVPYDVKVDETVYAHGLPTPALSVSPPPSYPGPVSNHIDSYFSIPPVPTQPNQAYPPTPVFTPVPQYHVNPANPTYTSAPQAVGLEYHGPMQCSYDSGVTPISRPATPYTASTGVLQSSQPLVQPFSSLQPMPATLHQPRVDCNNARLEPVVDATKSTVGHNVNMSTDSFTPFPPPPASPALSVATLPPYSTHQSTTLLSFAPPPSFSNQPQATPPVDSLPINYQQQHNHGASLHSRRSSSISYTPVGQQEVQQAYRPYTPYGAMLIPPPPPRVIDQNLAHELNGKKTVNVAPAADDINDLMKELTLDVKNQHLYAAQSMTPQSNLAAGKEKHCYYQQQQQPPPVYQPGNLDQKYNLQQSVMPTPAYQPHVLGSQDFSSTPYFPPPPTSY